MNGNSKPAQGNFEASYARALRGFLSGGSERELRHGYELGRRALAQEMGVLELALRHHLVLAKLISQSAGRASASRVSAGRALHMGGQFLMEALSPYEMRQRAYQEAAHTLRQLNETLEQEVKRIAHAVHDEAGQLLVAAHLSIAEVLRESNPQRRKQLLKVNRLLGQVGNHLRRLSHELRPTVLDDLGFAAAVRFLADSVAKRSRISVRVRGPLRGRLPPAVEIGLYRAIQEALANVTKHAHARRVAINIGKAGGRLHCTVKDDGVGFKPATALAQNGKRGLGLTGIEERVKGLGGTFQIYSQLGRGSTLRFSVPLEE